MNDTSTETSVEEKPQRVEARAAKDPAVRMFIFAAMLLGFGIWFFLDGHVHNKYPYTPFSESVNAWSKWALNYLGPFVLIPAGLVVVVWGVLFLRRVLVADQDGIGYAGKEKILWDQIARADASRLQSKGILYLHSEGKKLTLDSWKLQDFRNLIAFVENHIPPDRISK
jgi:hypothetical protein